MFVVQPDLHHSLEVPGDEVPLDLTAEAARVVRHEGSVDVTHPAAGHPQHSPPTHPHL